jgi:hypothetical protein
MAHWPSMAEVEQMTRGDSRNDLLRKIANLIYDVQVANEHAIHTDREIVKQNLHLEHTERLVKDHVSGKKHLTNEHWERAVKLAQPDWHDELPTVCPDCDGDMRHAGFDFHVCDSGCGFRYRGDTPTGE